MHTRLAIQFLRLTQYPEGKPVLVPVINVAFMGQLEDYTRIVFSGCKYGVNVVETIDQIERMMACMSWSGSAQTDGRGGVGVMTEDCIQGHGPA